MKNLYKYISTVFFIAFVFSLSAQQQNRFWYFGHNIGLDFGSELNNPIPVNGIGNNTSEGTGVISDNSGNFLFYTDGTRAINNQGQIITTDLAGDPSSTQSSIVVPSPNDCSEVYVFSVDYNAGNDGLGYNIINTTDWSVSSSVTLCDDCFEKVTAIPHSNGKDHWIISARPNSKRLPVYLLDESGVSSVNDSELTFIPSNVTLSYGAIRGSHDGTKLAVAIGGGGGNRVELLSFNSSTGEIDGFLNTYQVNEAYGLEFSPNSEYLLISGIGSVNSSSNQGTLNRFRTTAPYDLLDQITLNHNSVEYEGGALQLGPDNKIYLARDESNWLDVISTPDDPNDWGYQEQAIEFECTRCVDLGLPNLVGAPNECDPCDISNSLIPNPDFEELANGQEPDFHSQLDRAQSWVQATDATSDYFSIMSYPNRNDIQGYQNPAPPNGSDHFVGGWRGLDRPRTDPVTGEVQEYVEYIGTCLSEPILANSLFTLSLDLGSPIVPLTLSPEILDADFIVMGIPDCNFPIAGEDCKEDNYEVIGRKRIQIQQGTWQESVDVEISSSQDYPAIIFGLSCESQPLLAGYFLADEILVIQGENPCPSDCFSINAEAPPCNADIVTSNESTYTYNFTYVNETDEQVERLLIFDNDGQFQLEENGLIQLPSTLSPGQSVELSWDINAMTSFSEETQTYCFEIAPYNHGGACCKDEHCIELENCCPVLAPTKSLVKQDLDECCYMIDYETCVADHFVSLEIEMTTPDLTISGMAVLDGFQVTQMSETAVVVTMIGGGFFPAGTFDEIAQICVGNMNSMSPAEQEVSLVWKGLDGSTVLTYEEELCPLDCTPPEDECAELIDPVIYCDDDGVYHYQFAVRNINDRMLDASIVVLGPKGSTVPADFSMSTFPQFPDHTPIAAPYLAWQDATTLIDITLPNAVLGSTYEFQLSLHDYRNINAEDNDYWCCYTPIDFTIDVIVPCDMPSPSPMGYFIYPNPADDVFTVKFLKPLEHDAELVMTNINGEVRTRTQLAAGAESYSLGVGELNTGIYFIAVKDAEGNQHSQRFLKN